MFGDIWTLESVQLDNVSMARDPTDSLTTLNHPLPTCVILRETECKALHCVQYGDIEEELTLPFMTKDERKPE